MLLKPLKPPELLHGATASRHQRVLRIHTRLAHRSGLPSLHLVQTLALRQNRPQVSLHLVAPALQRLVLRLQGLVLPLQDLLVAVQVDDFPLLLPQGIDKVLLRRVPSLHFPF